MHTIVLSNVSTTSQHNCTQYVWQTVSQDNTRPDTLPNDFDVDLEVALTMSLACLLPYDLEVEFWDVYNNIQDNNQDLHTIVATENSHWLYNKVGSLRKDI
jgi:hypothetical protein